MIHRATSYDPKAPILVIDVGNTTISLATWHYDAVKTPLSVEANDEQGFRNAISGHMEAMPKQQAAAAVIASVAPETLKWVREIAEELIDRDALIVGEAVPLPIDVGVKDAKALGVDRACAAAAAYDTIQAACTVVDFGSAVTVDLVDDEGTLLGGAILPGLKMQFECLHEKTAVLPLVEAAVPELAYGRDTAEAIQVGVCRGLASAVRGLVEAYATSLSRWPQVVATGGDLEFIGPHCDFLDTLVSDLALRGVGLAYAKHLEVFGA